MKKKTLISMLLCACLMASVSFTGCSKPETVQTSVESSAASSEVSKDDSEVSEGASKEPEQKNEPITIDNIRNLVVGIDEPIELKDGTKRALINFDNAATTPVLSKQGIRDVRLYRTRLLGKVKPLYRRI